MKQQSTKLSATVIGMIFSVAAHANSDGKFISRQTLTQNNVGPQTIAELVSEYILITTSGEGWYRLNEQKVTSILATSSDEELKDFVSMLQTMVGDQTEVAAVQTSGITLSSQDHDGPAVR